MKQYIYVIALMIVGAGAASAQSSLQPYRPTAQNYKDSNYVRTYNFTAAEADAYNVTTEHYDGLGRKQAVVQHLFTPKHKNVCSYVVYDEVGREWKTFLPTPEVSMLSRDNDSDGFTYGDERTFSEIVYEASPLNRVTKEFGPGIKWKNKDKAKRTSYLANGIPGKSRGSGCYRLVNDTYRSYSEPFIEKKGYWPGQSLYVTTIQDESGRETSRFEDENGKLIMTKRRIDGRNLDTYYVYDDKDRLVAVLPPLVSETLDSKSHLSTSDEAVDRYAYLYMYDERDRCVAKKLPGCEWEYYIYDKGDRLVFTQDAELRKSGQWAFAISDIHGRACLSGVCTGEKNDLRASISNSNVLAFRAEYEHMGYGISGVTLIRPTILSVSYYDDYEYIDKSMPYSLRDAMRFENQLVSIGNALEISEEESKEAREKESKDGRDRPIDRPEKPIDHQIDTISMYIPVFQNEKWNYAQGRLTGRAERILGEEITNQFKWESYYYDRKGNIIQTHSTRLDGGVDVTNTTVSFTGKPSTVHVCHKKGATAEETFQEYYDYTYDNWDRPVRVRHRLEKKGIPSTWTTLSDIQYDAVGRMVADNRTGDPMLKTSFSYNVRSWKTTIAGPGYTEELFYEPGEEEKQINSSREWSGNISSTDEHYNTGFYHHEYGYDALSRLVSSSIKQGGFTSLEETFSYDDHTNIVNYVSTGTSAAEKSMSYNGNRMTSVTSSVPGASGSIGYDSIGRVISSDIEGMTEVKYNVVGYPSFVGQADGGYVHHTYTAGGARMASRRTDAAGVVTLMEYEGNEVIENGKLRMLLFDGGYVDFSGNAPRYCWYTKDHLGSVRAVADADGNVFATYAYSAYGEDFAAMTPAAPVTTNSTSQNSQSAPVSHGGGHLKDKEPFYPTVTYSPAEGPDWQPFKFSGKESLTRVGLDLYDFGARMYSPSNMRWMTMDPLCEKYYHISPYAYCAGNPVNLVDPDGRALETAWDLASLGMGVKSFVSNVKAGKVGAAIVDGIGIVVDAAAVVTPFVPGGAGAGLKAIRGAKKVADVLDVAKGADTAKDVAQAVNKVDDVADAAKGISGATEGSQKIYVTYTKVNPETGQVYSGRTSGYGSPEEIVKRRDSNHHMNDKGYGPASVDKASTNQDAIRGQEQYLIEKHGGAQSTGGTSGNRINGVSPKNPNRSRYEEARKKYLMY